MSSSRHPTWPVIWLLGAAALGLSFLPACAPTPAGPAPTGEVEASPASINTVAPEPTANAYNQSNGGGDPRTAGYWLLWNTCAEGNQAETARANGGRAEGWILVDDLLLDPGITVGLLDLTTCAETLTVLGGRDLAGRDRAGDPAYGLATQMLVAELNLSGGAESCQAALEAALNGQYLLDAIGFTGTGEYVLHPEAEANARLIAETLGEYNTGNLCVP